MSNPSSNDLIAEFVKGARLEGRGAKAAAERDAYALTPDLDGPWKAVETSVPEREREAAYRQCRDQWNGPGLFPASANQVQIEKVGNEVAVRVPINTGGSFVPWTCKLRRTKSGTFEMARP